MLGRSQEVDEPASVRSAWQEFGMAHRKHFCFISPPCLKMTELDLFPAGFYYKE